MRDSRIEELISAYVDGELSSDERLLVERELQQSTESRQLFEQLRRQRQMLQSLPRVRLGKDFADQVVRRLEDSKVTPGSPETQQSQKTSIRRLSLNVLLGAASVLAAGLLITLVLRGSKVEKNPMQPPPNDFVQPKEIDPEIRLASFSKRFPMLMVYEVSTTPKGRENKVFERWLTEAGIKFDKLVPIEERMETRVLESRFIANDLVPIQGSAAKDVSKTDVELILVRGKTNQLAKIIDPWFKIRGQAQDEVHVKTNMAMSKELAIFLHLNDAVDGDGAVRQVSSDTWTTPGTYRLKFRYAFNTKQSAPKVSTTSSPLPNLESAIPGQVVPPQSPAINFAVNADEKKEQGAIVPQGQQPLSAESFLSQEENAPSQVLVIVRHLSENVVFPAVKPRPGN